MGRGTSVSLGSNEVARVSFMDPQGGLQITAEILLAERLRENVVEWVSSSYNNAFQSRPTIRFRRSKRWLVMTPSFASTPR
ncbi:MAG: hypothetical protein KF751_12955 [Nitrospira sp.]|nr:hypothetical protein [Nitrospira sp.]